MRYYFDSSMHTKHFSGTNIPIIDPIVDADFVLSFLLNSSVTGFWMLKMDVSTGQYSVDVATRSFIDFIYDILQERSGLVVPVEGQPTAGKSRCRVYKL